MTGFLINSYNYAATSTISDVGLKALWNMNEASGNLLNTSESDNAMSDSYLATAGTTGYGATGHISGLDSYDYAGGDGDKAVANNTKSDYDFLTKTNALFTLMWWSQFDSTSGADDLFGTGGSTSSDLSIRYRGVVDDKFAIFLADEGEQLTTLTVSNTNWHFYMLQYDNSVGTLKMSVDNGTVENVATGLNIENTAAQTGTFGFGDNSSSTNEFNGKMQQFMMFNKIVSASDITKMYNSGNGTLFY